MLLRRLSYPCRYGNMIQRFAKPVPLFSMVTNILIDHIYAIHGRRIAQWNLDILSPDVRGSYRVERFTLRRLFLGLSMAPYGQSHDQERISGLCTMDTRGSMP